MRVVVQRVSEASVTIDGRVEGAIGQGILILLGIETTDSSADVDILVAKLPKLRIFSDAEGKMNLSCSDVNGGYLVISQFTLHASTKKGNRPSYIQAARPEQAVPLYEEFLKKLALVSNQSVQCGEFGADMKVSLINDGPVTILIDTKE